MMDTKEPQLLSPEVELKQAHELLCQIVNQRAVKITKPFYFDTNQCWGLVQSETDWYGMLFCSLRANQTQAMLLETRCASIEGCGLLTFGFRFNGPITLREYLAFWDRPETMTFQEYMAFKDRPTEVSESA